jgi:hypothetical protein
MPKARRSNNYTAAISTMPLRKFLNGGQSAIVIENKFDPAGRPVGHRPYGSNPFSMYFCKNS